MFQEDRINDDNNGPDGLECSPACSELCSSPCDLVPEGTRTSGWSGGDCQMNRVVQLDSGYLCELQHVMCACYSWRSPRICLNTTNEKRKCGLKWLRCLEELK